MHCEIEKYNFKLLCFRIGCERSESKIIEGGFKVARKNTETAVLQQEGANDYGYGNVG